MLIARFDCRSIGVAIIDVGSGEFHRTIPFKRGKDHYLTVSLARAKIPTHKGLIRGGVLSSNYRSTYSKSQKLN